VIAANAVSSTNTTATSKGLLMKRLLLAAFVALQAGLFSPVLAQTTPAPSPTPTCLTEAAIRIASAGYGDPVEEMNLAQFKAFLATLATMHDLVYNEADVPAFDKVIVSISTVPPTAFIFGIIGGCVVASGQIPVAMYQVVKERIKAEEKKDGKEASKL